MRKYNKGIIIAVMFVAACVLTGCGDRSRDIPNPIKDQIKRTDAMGIKNADVTILPTTTPTPLPIETITGTKDGAKNKDEDKISKELTYLKNTACAAEVEIIFGDPYEAGEKLFASRYPEEYKAYYSSKEYGEFAGDDEDILGTRGAELHNTLPLVWYQEQEAEFFAKYPELRICVANTDEYIRLIIAVPYSEMLRLVTDPQVLKIQPYSREGARTRVIGEYNGRTVYDVDTAFEFDYLFSGVLHEAGDLVCNLDMKLLQEADEEDYFRVAFVLQPGREYIVTKLRSKCGEKADNTEKYNSWLKSKEGRNAYKESVYELTKSGTEVICGKDWVVLDDGYDDVLDCCKGRRYVIVLATKKQLANYLPDINQYLANNIAPNKQSIDPTSTIYIYPAGVVRMLIDHTPIGELIQ